MINKKIKLLNKVYQSFNPNEEYSYNAINRRTLIYGSELVNILNELVIQGKLNIIKRNETIFYSLRQ